MSDANIGKRIKTFSAVLWWINVAIVIIAMIAGIFAASTALRYSRDSSVMILAVLGVLLGGALEMFLAYFIYLQIRGYGHLIDRVNEMCDKDATIINKMTSITTKLDELKHPV